MASNIEKVLNIIIHKGNINLNYFGIPLHSTRNCCHHVNKCQQTLLRMWGKKSLSATGGNVHWCSHHGKQCVLVASNDSTAAMASCTEIA